jgi:hemoglobin/transferrin/lactoferrin receptor protein
LANYVLRSKSYFRTINTAYINTVKGISINAEKSLTQHALNYGLKLESTNSSRPWSEDRLVQETGAHQITIKNRMADMDGQNLSLYLSDKIKFYFENQKAVFTPSIRYENRQSIPKNLNTYIIGVPAAASEIKKQTNQFLSPSLRLDLQQSPNINSFFSYSKNTRPVSAAEKTGTYDSFSYTGNGQGYAILGNPHLKNESSHAFEVGFSAKPNAAMNIQVSSFYNSYSNFIEYIIQNPDPINYPTISYGLYRPENIGQARTWGAEISTQVNLEKLISSWQGMYVDFALGAVNGTAKNTKTGARNFLPSIAPMKAHFTFGYKHPQKLYGISLSGNFVDDKQAPIDVVMSGVELPRYHIPKSHLFDANAFWNINKNLKINLSILNISNQRYWNYANSRKLAAPKSSTDIATLNEIERQVMPGRSINLSMQLTY